jgi:Na+/proline symporter/signal transduction histidine kinase/CheY-like chemotaxis protein
MIAAWVIVVIALGYVGCLFAVAYWGDKQAKRRKASRERPTIYALSLAVYCTSWTFFGSVGLATSTGLDFLAVYIGPIVVFAFGRPLIERIIKLSKSQNITSIADFLAARYGKNPLVAAIVTVIAVAGVLPYIALQLKAVSQSITTLVQPLGWATFAGYPAPLTDITFLIAMTMALFAILFGTRHIEATEHQEGLMLAIAMESVVKIAAFLIVGAYITYSMFGGIGALIEQATHQPEIIGLFARGFHGGTWLTVTFLSSVCILLLTRQFHVTIVENNSPREVGRASWLFPLYLIAINIFVVPIALAGMLTFSGSTVDRDMFLIALPLSQGAEFFTILAFLGGLSAATAMVIVESVALSIMVCNDLVMPIILHRRQGDVADRQDMGAVLLIIRRCAIFAILLLAYSFYRLVGDAYGLASIGLLSFAAIAQFAPAFFGGLMWRGATARGAIAGILAGFAVWAYTLLLPYFVKAGLMAPDIMTEGLFGWALLRPEVLFYMSFDPLTHGVVWSLIFNILAYVTVSLLREPEPIERLQANVFIENDFPRAVAPSFRPWRTSVTVEDLIRTVARYLGEERTQRSFADYAMNNNTELNPKAEADIHLMRFTENLLASAIGTASSRLVMSLTIRRRNVGMKSALKLLDDASEAIQYNRDLLQSALDQVGQGIAVFDRNMRLICWNREFREILALPPVLRQVGVPLDQIVRYMADGSGAAGVPAAETVVSERLRKYCVTNETFQERLTERRVIEVRTNPMPQGGIVATYTDISDRVAAAEALARANETLERRVRERTAELMQANKALGEAKAKADEANLDKTRFLAAASHDILQPLNAARLYVSSLVERKPPGPISQLSRNIDTSLEAVEEILNALLDISRLDTGALKPEIDVVAIGELMQQLGVEFEPQALEKGLTLRVMPCSLHVRTDRRLLRRVLQNLVSNAVKYTDEGRVLIGCRRRKGRLVVEVHDTGPGIPLSKHGLIFKEFERLNTGGKAVQGIGLGLSIVQRIGRMLDHPIKLSSRPGYGSIFGVQLPIADAREARRPIVPFVSAAHYRQFNGCVVLCVDNEPAILDGMRSLLGNWQCNVLIARDAQEALRVLAERGGGAPPDIILADYHLEQGTGPECIAAIRASAGFKVPAILITADRSPDVEQEARSLDLPILRKPLKPAALRALMARLYSRRTAAE